jgi:uncharacterized circularly permuted ATP-grasp superfamily protein
LIAAKTGCIFFVTAKLIFMNTENLLHNYPNQPGIWDEMWDVNAVRPQFQQIILSLQQLDVSTLHHKDKQASELFMNQGITFTVYTDDAGIERIFPFDIIPRIITEPGVAKN